MLGPSHVTHGHWLDHIGDGVRAHFVPTMMIGASNGRLRDSFIEHTHTPGEAKGGYVTCLTHDDLLTFDLRATVRNDTTTAACFNHRSIIDCHEFN